MKSATLVQDFAVGKPLSAVITVTNSGETPALDVVVTGDIVSRQSIELVEFKTDKLDSPPPSVMVIPPGTIATVPISSIGAPIASQGHIDAFTNGPYKLFARGFILYRDVYGNRRRTTYCFKAEGKDLEIMRKLGVGMAACDRWNTAE